MGPLPIFTYKKFADQNRISWYDTAGSSDVLGGRLSLRRRANEVTGRMNISSFVVQVGRIAQRAPLVQAPEPPGSKLDYHLTQDCPVFPKFQPPGTELGYHPARDCPILPKLLSLSLYLSV